MTTETKEKVQDALTVLVDEMTSVDELKPICKGYIAGVKRMLVEDIISGNYFEIDSAGSIVATDEPTKHSSSFESFIASNRISVLPTEKKTLSQLITETKRTKLYGNFFK